jgi:hypothetical protein
MKSFIEKNVILIAALYLLVGCSEDFLDENLDEVPYPVGLSNIYVSPDWESSAYLFSLPSVNGADYEITFKPSWLNINSSTGRINNGVAVVECSAAKNPEFEKVGIYVEFMTVKANEKTYKVPVAYIIEGNPVAQVQSTLSLTYSTYDNPHLEIQNAGEGILLWNIISMPDWLVLDTARLDSRGIYLIPNSGYNIPLRIKPGVNSGILTGKIVLSTNDKGHPAININVIADLGLPQLNLYTTLVNLSYTSTSANFNFSNNGNGILVWEFENIPEWITITPSSGINGPYTYGGNIIISCNRSLLSPGQNTAIIKLKTNDSAQPSSNITIIAYAPGNNANISSVDGSIADAFFNRNTNILYFVTSTPNKFVAYNVTSRTVLNEIPLSKAPTSFAISEDWAKAAVGHNGMISAINLSDNTVAATYDINYSVNDMAWGEGDWFCSTQNGGSFPPLHWINIADGTMYNTAGVGHGLDGKSVVKKVPGQGYLIASRNATSPSGFIAYDVASKSVKSYSHMDLHTFWFSENGEYVFATNLNVYRTSSSTSSNDTFDTDINPVGKINVGDQSYYGLQHLYHSNNHLWILKKTSYSADASTTLCQVEDNDYTFVRNIYYDLLYQPDAQTTPFNLTANYVFVNNEGTEIIVLSRGVSNSSWVMQFIPVSDL